MKQLRLHYFSLLGQGCAVVVQVVSNSKIDKDYWIAQFVVFCFIHGLLFFYPKIINRFFPGDTK